ncbi:nucleoside-diphosphate kinase [Streptomyces sp. NPDC091267]|uniref:nucleoside-diphosphate kinase n=1 Tax=Streptomyces sp. NPDC091267 TaxID=3155195 RepID=UPI00341ABF4B
MNTASADTVHPGLPPLTRNPLKARLYSQETYFRESYADLSTRLGGDTAPALLRHALAVVKPDGWALGVAATVLDFFLEHGFEVVDVRPVTFSPAAWRTMWTYQMTQASLDRLMVNDLVIRGQGVALLLRGPADDPLPAAVRLSDLKGPARAEAQREDCLRRVISQPNRIFSLVHSADEPADLVRELGILFARSQRREMAAAMAGDAPSPSTRDWVGRIRENGLRPPRTYDRSASLKRVLSTATARLTDSPLPAPVSEALAVAVEALRAGGRTSAAAALDAFADAGVQVSAWDLAAALSEVIEADVPDGSKILENFGVAAWEVS